MTPLDDASDHLRLRTLPGAQATVDWGHFGHFGHFGLLATWQ